MNPLSITLFAAIIAFSYSTVSASEGLESPVIYPKDNSITGEKVNLVVDPTDVLFFQASVGGMEYPVVDTSTGVHAVQGIELEPGANTITVNVFDAAPKDGKSASGLAPASTHQVRVFSMVDLFTGKKAERGYSREPFHTREREAVCASCHRMDALQGGPLEKPEDIICSSCHKKIPSGKHIHGPVAAWNCLACHNPDLYPVKYQFTSADPWKGSRSTQTAAPASYTFSSAEIFAESSAELMSKDKAKRMLQEVFSYIKKNPGDKILIEAHTDNAPPKKEKGKKAKGFKNNQALTAARAKTLAAVFKEAGVNGKKITAAGMGEKLPKAPNETKEGREANNRVEIVIHPADVKIKNSMKLPALTDRERVIINLDYAQGAPVKKLRVVEKLPKGVQYVKGSGVVRSRAAEPKAKGDDLIWDLGDLNAKAQAVISYVVKKDKKAPTIPDQIKILYAGGGNKDIARVLDPKVKAGNAMTVMDACLGCHGGIMDGSFRHGPADAGYCNICHNPHASSSMAWLRKPTWDLCVTCHSEKAEGVHVVSGITGVSHPTKSKRDISRPGKHLSCTSCHNPHSAENMDLYVNNIKTRSELCSYCHGRK